MTRIETIVLDLAGATVADDGLAHAIATMGQSIVDVIRVLVADLPDLLSRLGR